MSSSESRPSSIDHDRDAELLASLGYKQELKRRFSPFEIFSIGFSMLGLVSAFSSVLLFSIPNGGPSAMVWGWTLCSFFLMTIGLAMGELASAAPTSGGLYYWTFMFSTPKWRCFLSWIVGYANTISNISGVAGVDWACAVQIMAAVSIGSDLRFQPTTAQTYGLFCALLISHGLINSVTPRVIARLQSLFFVVNVLLCAAVIISLLAATPKELRNDAKFALGGFVNLSGWSDGFAFVISFFMPAWTMGFFDGPVHISEEATNANTAVPYAIIFPTCSGLILGWGINVALAFCMGKDLQGILDSPVGQPMATILLNSLGKIGALVIWCVIISVQYAMGAGGMTATSRQVFAFSRDGGLPLSRWVYHVNRRVYAPVRAVWFSVTLGMMLGALTFAGPSAIDAMFSLAITGQYLAYSIPISARFLGGKKLKKGPVSFGRLSLPIAAIAVTWMIVMSVIIMFPQNPNPGVRNMNYAVVVQGGVLFLATAYYFFPTYGGMYWFKGPVLNVTREDVSSDVLEAREKDGIEVPSPAKSD
ncbi:amino acid transporter [Dendrothele bispora CBS 962.96]|uniref:Amino acid transporter n=1 Tax=Dendrothele bispora (strain CBS 962.96) TaxID=1314807 RepID=A0A4S8M8U9_DENBC|nr:amino acid transporter [Dendrothele bispora CBS 962.96]